MAQGKRRWWLVCSILCGCSGGPISDLPLSGGGRDDEPAAGGPNTPDQAGSGNNGGAANPEPPAAPPSGGSGGAGSEDGDGLSGGGADAGLPSGDPTAPDCDYVAQDGSEACGGAYCGLSAAELEAQIMPGGACATDQAELALVCSNTLPVTVNGCFQDALAAGAFGAAEIDACAIEAPELMAASADCVRCYLEETRCALTHCLVYCLSENGEAACKSCRETHCGETFRTCSGLPAAP